MEKKLKAIYSRFLNLDKQEKNVKCKARKRICKKCGYRFKKDETICPVCKTERAICGNWAVPGRTVCRFHGGRAGRPITKGVHLSKASFSEEEMSIIKKNIEQKTREHEFAYQVCVAAFKKIIDNTSDNPEHLLEAGAIYFSKIAKYMNDIDAIEASMTHIHTFDEIDKQKLGDKIKSITDRVLQNALLIIDALLKKEISDKALYEKIYNQIPDIYKNLMNEKLKAILCDASDQVNINNSPKEKT